jgi:hypothetical protein
VTTSAGLDAADMPLRAVWVFSSQLWVTGEKQKTSFHWATGLKPVFASSKLQLGSSFLSYGNNNFGRKYYGLSTAMLSELLTMVFNW